MRDHYSEHGQVRIEPTENGWILHLSAGQIGTAGQQWVATTAVELSELVRQWAVNTKGERPVYPMPGAEHAGER